MNKERFEVKEEHLKLMHEFEVEWDDGEFGAPRIDCKRPYGNSDVENDMLKILGITELRDGVFSFHLFGKKYLLKGEDINNIEFSGNEDTKLVEQLNKLHKETQTALQICLNVGKFEAGIYETEKYMNKWKKVN